MKSRTPIRVASQESFFIVQGLGDGWVTFRPSYYCYCSFSKSSVFPIQKPFSSPAQTNPFLQDKPISQWFPMPSRPTIPQMPRSTLDRDLKHVPACTQSHDHAQPHPFALSLFLLYTPLVPSLGADLTWSHLHLANSPCGPCIELLCCPFPCDKGSGYRVIDWFSCRQMGPFRASIEILGCMGWLLPLRV